MVEGDDVRRPQQELDLISAATRAEVEAFVAGWKDA